MPKNSKPPPASSAEPNFTEELLEALLDERIVEAIGSAISPSITKAVADAVNKAVADAVNKAVAPFVAKIETLSATVKKIEAENVRLSKRCEAIEEDNKRLKKDDAECGRRLDDLEAYSRADNLIIRGLPESSAAERASAAPSLTSSDSGSTLRKSFESVQRTVIDFAIDKLGIRVLPQDISVAHRIKAGKKDKVRPIIVRFVSRNTRNAIYSARKSLKDSNPPVFISEHLTKTVSELFFEARKMLSDKKIHAAWTQNGLVYVRFSSDTNFKPTIIRSGDLVPKP